MDAIAVLSAIQVGLGEHCFLTEMNPVVHESFYIRVSNDSHDIFQCGFDQQATCGAVWGV